MRYSNIIIGIELWLCNLEIYFCSMIICNKVNLANFDVDFKWEIENILRFETELIVLGRCEQLNMVNI